MMNNLFRDRLSKHRTHRVRRLAHDGFQVAIGNRYYKRQMPRP